MVLGRDMDIFHWAERKRKINALWPPRPYCLAFPFHPFYYSVYYVRLRIIKLKALHKNLKEEKNFHVIFFYYTYFYLK